MIYRRACIEGMRKFVRHLEQCDWPFTVGQWRLWINSWRKKKIDLSTDTATRMYHVARCWVGHFKAVKLMPSIIVPTIWRLGSLLAAFWAIMQSFCIARTRFLCRVTHNGRRWYGGPCQALNFSFKPSTHQVEIWFSKPQRTIKHHMPESLGDLKIMKRMPYFGVTPENRMLAIQFTTWYLIIWKD